MSDIALHSAQVHLDLFNVESVQLHGNDAAEQRDCGDLIELGIQAFRWIERVEERWRDDIRSGKILFDPAAEQSITSLYEAWLTAYQGAERVISLHADLSEAEARVHELRECGDQAREVLETKAWVKKSRLVRAAADQSDD